eukprot:TRINITY_DN37975_c0_g1_i1.p1 TRINITY_DN37975_c0_g1~~TRINITY_DN37975_c0_g1_i1.p1  ORF type:complete len:156 (+),score=11.60 TRINITY_DN37975_c0_g1_i1:163-630(+)
MCIRDSFTTEATRFALSPDGTHLTPLNDGRAIPELACSPSTSVRDPFLNPRLHVLSGCDQWRRVREHRPPLELQRPDHVVRGAGAASHGASAEMWGPEWIYHPQSGSASGSSPWRMDPHPWTGLNSPAFQFRNGTLQPEQAELCILGCQREKGSR